MDRIHLSALGKVDDRRDIQIRGQRAFVLADEVGLIRARSIQTVCIFLRIDCNGAKVQVIAGAEDALRDLAAIGDKDLLNFRVPMVNQSFPNID